LLCTGLRAESAGEPRFRLVELPPPHESTLEYVPESITDGGMVAGEWTDNEESGILHAFRWTESGGPEVLGGPSPLGFGGLSVAGGNDAGEVAGSSWHVVASHGEWYPVLWAADGVPHQLRLRRDSLGRTEGINALGQVLVSTPLDGPLLGTKNAAGKYRWRSAGPKYLTPSGLNDRGAVLLNDGVSYYRYPETRLEGRVTRIRPPHRQWRQVNAFDLNNRGAVVGEAGKKLGDGATQRAWLWQKGRWAWLPLLPGTVNARAWAVNDRSDIVGYSDSSHEMRGVLWRRIDGVWRVFDLSDLADLTPGLRIIGGRDINRRGEIAVFLWDTREGEGLQRTGVLRPD
jgi:hypothetical protein